MAAFTAANPAAAANEAEVACYASAIGGYFQRQRWKLDA